MVEAMNDKYLVVLDDDDYIAPLIEKFLGIPCKAFCNSKDLLSAHKSLDPMAAFIDIHLSEDDSGLDVIPELRKAWRKTVIVVITAEDSEQIIMDALSTGADDFVRKPLLKAEVVARLQLRLRELVPRSTMSERTYRNITIDLTHNRIKSDSDEAFLSNTELSLLMTLVDAEGSTVQRDTLKRQCWGRLSVTDGALDRKVHQVRKAIKDANADFQIKAVYGEGFSIKALEE